MGGEMRFSPRSQQPNVQQYRDTALGRCGLHSQPSRLQSGQHLIANPDDALDQKTGHDRELVPHRFGFAQIQIRCFAPAVFDRYRRLADEIRPRIVPPLGDRRFADSSLE